MLLSLIKTQLLVVDLQTSSRKQPPVGKLPVCVSSGGSMLTPGIYQHWTAVAGNGVGVDPLLHAPSPPISPVQLWQCWPPPLELCDILQCSILWPQKWS